MLKKHIFMLLLSVSTFCISQEKEFIFGQLVDSTRNDPIPFATIRIKDKAQGVITNIDGTFKIPLRFKILGAAIEISCMGYMSKEVLIENLVEDQSNIIILKQGAFELNEAVVSANIKKLSAKLIDCQSKEPVIKPDSFGIKDWESAMGMLNNLEWELELIELTKGRIDKKIES